MSIVELKIYHMGLQTLRPDALPDHLERCRGRLAVLKEQKADLTAELNELAEDVLQGRKKLKVYRQYKMYNDPSYRPKS